MERRLPKFFNYLRTFPIKQFATLQRGFHFKNLHKTGHAISEITGHDIFEMTGHTAEITGHVRVKYALKTSTDARSKLSTYSYDALNRVTGVTFSDATPALGYLYDDITAGNYGKGRLTKITDGTGNTTFKYDIQGRLIQKTQTTSTVIKTVSYGYDPLGRMNAITYPSGKVLTYTFDVQGRVASIAVNAVNLVSSITYQPFGPAKSWTWSGGPAQTRAFDLDGRQTSYPYTATGTVNLAYDLGNRITALTGSVAKTYAYDKLDRLTGYGTAITYQYDANGNRTQFKNGTAISTYNNPTTSNRLSSITGTGPEAYTYDLAGNTTAIAAKTLAYDARGRLTTHTSGTTVTTFGINAIGQRLVKAGATAALTTRFVYGEDGKLLGEYDNAGALITEHVYLGDTPLAAIKTAGAYMIQADHLNTPRAILGAANVLAWKWDSDAFGTTAANENPSALGIFNYNLRFPGQYYDKETLTHYNYFRDYNPKTGRYIESDPIGLKGGINTFAYVKNNPITKIDPNGLGPLSFGACTVANGGYQVYSFRQTMKDLDTTSIELIQSILNRVNDEIGKCPMNNTKRLGDLMTIKNNLESQLLKALQKPAQTANMFGIGDASQALAIEGACAVLMIAPTP
jgi:RHS repeat-associated protein